MLQVCDANLSVQGLRASGTGSRRGHPLSPLHCYVTILPLLYIYILHIYILYSIYIYTYTWTYYCLYEAGETRKRNEKKIYIYVYTYHDCKPIYIYIYAYIYEKNTLPGITRFLRFLVPSFSCSHVWFSLLSWPFPVPPIIEPFTFQEGLSEGMRTRTVCGVAAGDPPLTISWLKDGQSPFPLPPNLASVANVSQLDPYSSLLSITNLAAEHSGDYTCVAANPAAEVRYTAKLQVKGN